ncbi:MAG TPA: carboxypeptidase regulatory-like domain-containing protein [Kofleriaceae bacterium]
MNKSRGILILSMVAAAAIGLFLYMRRGGERAPGATVTAKGSATHAQPPTIAMAEPAKLIVTVTDDKGPLAGATVRLEDDKGDVEIVQAGKDGIARAETLAAGTWQISASADGHEPAALRARELHAGEVVNVEVKLPLGGRTLTGVVTDATAGPISGARIDAAKLGAVARPSDAVASTFTGADGTYKLTVAEGQLLVAASDASYAPQSRYVEVGAAGASANFQLVPGGVIEGVVRDEQTRDPVPGARVLARRDAPAMLLGERAQHEVTTGTDGRFRIAGLRPGAYELGARAAKRASHAPTIVGLGVAEQVTDVEIVIGNAPVIRGIVVDDTGAPAPNVSVSAFSGPGDGAEARSDAKGTFVIEGLDAGSYRLMGRGEHFVPAGMTPVELADKDIDGVKVNVRRGLRIKGHVERRQVCDVQLEFDETAMSRGDMPTFIAPMTTGPDGEFDIGPAQAIGYEISARCASGEQGHKKIDVKPGMADVIVEVKPGASIAGKVIDGAGKPVAGVTVMAAPIGGTERTMIVNGMVTSGVQTLTNAAGAFELRGLSAGAHRLRVLDRGRPLPMKSEGRVTVTAVERKTGVVLTVERPDGVIRGVVTDPGGQPIREAWVSLHQDIHDMIGETMDRESSGSRMIMVEASDDGGDTGGMPPVLTDEHGKFEIRNLPRVKWTVIAEAQAGKLRGRAVGVVPDADIKIQALGLTEVKGKVIAPGGMPSSFQVELAGPTHAQRGFASRDGTFSFSRIDPGDYTVNVSSSAGNGRATVKVLPGQTANVEITLAANAIVIGKLVDAAGKGVGGLPLAIIPDSGDGRRKVELHGMPPTSNPDGTFRLEAKAGPSVLMVLGGGQPTSKSGLNLEAGKTLDVGTITVGGGPAPP